MSDESKNSIQFNAEAETDARLDLLYEIGRILASLATMNEAAPQILEAVCRRLHFELGELWCLGKNETVLKLESVWHAPSLENFVAESRRFEFAPGDGLPGKAWARNAPVWLENLSGAERMPRQFFAAENNLQSGFAFPIVFGERFLGAVSFFSRDARQSDDALLQMFAAVGNHIGQFIKREKIESTLRASEERYRAFVAQSTEGIWRFELDEKFPVNLPIEKQVEIAFERGYLAECNDAMARMYGLTKAEELVGSRVADLLDATDAANVEYLRSFIASGYNLIDAESHEKDANGNDKYFLNSLVGIVENGFLVRVWGTQRDITEQHCSEKFLAENEARYRALVEATSTVVWRANENGELNFVGSVWEKVSGQRIEEMLGSGWLAALHPDDREKAARVWRGALESKSVYETEFRVLTIGGEYRWFAVRGVPILNEDGSLREWVGANTDVHERKAAESRLALLAEISELLTRTIDGADDLLFAVATAVGENLRVRRCLFNEIDLENDRETVHRDYCRGVASVAGAHRISDYSPITSAEMRAGKTVVNDDSKVDARTAEDYEKIYEPNGERAYVAVPLLRENRWVASLWVSDDAPRAWSAQEISLLETVAERTWTALEKSRINHALGESRRNLETALKAGRMGSWSLDLASSELAASDACKMNYGREPGDSFTYQDLTDAVHPEDRARWRAVIDEAIGKCAEFEIEYRVLFPDDSVHWVTVRGNCFADGAGVTNLLAGVSVDITARKQAEENLTHQKTLLEALTESVLDGILIVSPDGKMLHFNRQFLDIWNFPAEIVESKSDERALEWAASQTTDPPQFLERVGNIYRQPDNTVREEMAMRDGRVYERYGAPIMIGETRLAWVWTFRDITRRKRNENALRESEERYRRLFNSIDEGFCVIEMIFDEAGEPFDYRFLQTNPTFEKQTGLADTVGKRMLELAPQHEKYWFEIYGAVARTGEAVRFENYAQQLGRWFDVYAFRFGAPEKQQVAVLFKDITERKEIETERERILEAERQAREVAEQANFAKDEFIALVSHELRSPLNAMLGWTRILQNQKPDEETKERALDVIVRNARSQSRLIDDLLDIARVSKGKLRLELQPTELIPIINAAVEIIKPAAEAADINFSQTLDETANLIFGDIDRLRQVIDNLLANAVKFTAPGDAIELRLERENGRAKIIISDTGQGISEEFLPQIFERFKQADLSTTRRHGGLGIGLSLARDLVELHGGAISAASAGIGKGSTFTVRLPLRAVKPFTENSDRVKAMNGQGKLSGFWILAVDDEADARELVSFMLQINGAKVTTANSAVEALDILKSSEGRLPDILLSDISMPNESGYALLEKIRALPEEHGGQIPAVALTAFSRPEDREAAYEAGFQKHLGKPVEPDVLIAAIIETAGSAKQI